MSKYRKVIFLDFDGVLNSDAFLRKLGNVPHGEKHIDIDCVLRLNTLVEISKAEVCISSSWRIPYSVEQLTKFLVLRGFEHPEKIVGKTPHGNDRISLDRVRGAEIDDWLQKQKKAGQGVDYFVILDDSDDMEPHMAQLVRTDWMVGITDKHVQDALIVLGMDPNKVRKKGGLVPVAHS